MSANPVVTTAELADILQLSVRRINEYASQGVIERKSKGYFYLIPSVKGYINYMKSSSVTRDGGPTDIHDSKARKAKADARLAEVRADKAKGGVVEVEAMRMAAAGVVGTLANSLQGLPGRLAGLVHGLETRAEIRSVITAEVKQVRGTMATGMRKMVDSEVAKNERAG